MTCELLGTMRRDMIIVIEHDFAISRRSAPEAMI